MYSLKCFFFTAGPKSGNDKIEVIREVSPQIFSTLSPVG